MKIAIICSSFFPVVDGVTIAIYHRVKQLSALGYQIKLFCPSYREISHIYQDWQQYTGEIFPGVEVINLPSTKSLALDFERDVTIKSYRLVLRELQQFQPDIIHVDEAERLGICWLKIPGVKFAKQHNIPCVAWFHTNYLDYFDDYFQLPLGLNNLIKSALSLIFAKIYNAYNLTLAASHVTQKKLTVMGVKNIVFDNILGCDIKRFNCQAKTSSFFSERYSLPDLSNKVKLTFVGRLTPDKGWKFTMKALAKLPSEILDSIAILIVGDGTLKDEISRNLKQLIPDIYLLGRIPPESIPELLVNSDIFVTNSEKETKGLTIIEAAAAGIPAIAPRMGGAIDTIRDGETGYLYHPQDINNFLDKLAKLIMDRPLREAMGAKAKEIAQQWSWQQTNNNLIEIWLQQINNKTLI